MRVIDIPTPALVLEKSIFDKNLIKMKELCEKFSLSLRPHYKSNKCPYIAKRQVELGAVGVCCAKLGEAVDLAENGINNILIANEITDLNKIKIMAELSKKVELSVLIDTKENAVDIEKALEEADSEMNAYVELDTGMNRCGGSVDNCVELALFVKKNLKRLNVIGIQAYAGHLSHMTDNDERSAMAENVTKEVLLLVQKLKENGVVLPIISGVSTGTIMDKSKFSVYNEVQTGSYIFSDAAYNKLPIPFENSLFVLTTVISVKPDRFVTDSGVKTCGIDQGMLEISGLENYTIELHEEHGLVNKENHNFKVNDRIRYIPGHCCSTVNLYDKIYLIDGENVLDIIPIISRGKSQ